MDIKSRLVSFLLIFFKKELVTVIIAALPIFELRLSLPLAIIKFNFSFGKAYSLSVLGNMLPIFPLLIFFKYFFHKLEYIKFIGRFFKWWFMRVRKRSSAVEKWGFWGLVFFVSIPLPVTGAWTGTVAASLFDFSIKKAFLAIMLGVLLAGLWVGIVSFSIDKIMF